ncbi:MAG: HlyD family secretion protein, partial [Pseudorhodoplanes sp.]
VGGLIIVAVAAAAIGIGWFDFQFHGSGNRQFEGWIEGRFVFVSPDEVGRLETVSVREGDQVAAGDPLFSLDDDLQRAAVAEAEASLTNSKIVFERAKDLLNKKVGSQKAFDDAEAAMRTAQARLNSARTRLDRRSVASPASGMVQEVYFRVGEMVQSGQAIVSILPPGNIRVRFFVPQAEIPRIKLGDVIQIKCDGCAGDLTAKVNFISAEAEFTPPVIYSQEERARLVFRIEALPVQPEKLRVGQPVSAVLPPEGKATDVER